ncbi:MAG: hypothetical protein AAF731_15230 [Bacteroidota bacterium]
MLISDVFLFFAYYVLCKSIHPIYARQNISPGFIEWYVNRRNTGILPYFPRDAALGDGGISGGVVNGGLTVWAVAFTNNKK